MERLETSFYVKLVRVCFVIKLIKHTEQLLGNKEEIFCIQILNNSCQRMISGIHKDEKVFQILF